MSRGTEVHAILPRGGRVALQEGAQGPDSGLNSDLSPMSKTCRQCASESVGCSTMPRARAVAHCSKRVHKYVFAAGFIGVAAGVSFAQAPAPLPDLTAAYIGLSPRYPAYAVRD